MHTCCAIGEYLPLLVGTGCIMPAQWLTHTVRQTYPMARAKGKGHGLILREPFHGNQFSSATPFWQADNSIDATPHFA